MQKLRCVEDKPFQYWLSPPNLRECSVAGNSRLPQQNDECVMIIRSYHIPGLETKLNLTLFSFGARKPILVRATHQPRLPSFRCDDERLMVGSDVH